MALAVAALLVMGASRSPATEPDYLSDWPELIESATQDWGTLGFDVAAGGKPLQIGAQYFKKGLGHHANGVITVLAEGAYESFDAEVGLQPCAGGSVSFRVVVDGQQRFDSGVMRSGDAAKPVHVPLAGAKEVRLEAGDAGDGIKCDLANWANARLTPATNATGLRPAARSVDMARFARVVTWNPRRGDGARASRLEEFRGEDVFTETELKPNPDGNYTVPARTNGAGCIGLQWLNRRALRELGLEIMNNAPVPSPELVRVEGWVGRSAWQGNWTPLAGECRLEDRRLIFKLASKAVAVPTQKIRWVLPPSASPMVTRCSAFTRSSWAVTNLFVQFDPQKKVAGTATGEVTIWNGERVDQSNTKNPKAEISWSLSEPLHLNVRYSRPAAYKSDPTVLQFRLPTGDVGVAVEDVLANDCVYLPDHGLFVAREPLPVTLADYQQRIAGRKSLLEEVRALPDQTFAQAMTKTHHEIQNEGPVLLSLAGDNTKFAVERDGAVRFQTSPDLKAFIGVASKTWLTRQGEMRAQFGSGKLDARTRALDGGWLPISVITLAKDGLLLRQRSYVAPCDEPGNRPTRLNRLSVCVIEFTITNTLAQPADASLSLTFLLNAAEKQPAGLSAAPDGWVVRGENGEVGRIVTSPARPLTVSATNNALFLAGKLVPRQAVSFTAFFPAQPTDIAALPGVAKLRAATEAYWRAALATATQIETPDALLNDIIRASQVRCLIAARNEADGERIAAWAGAARYGPLESEAHSVIRGMDFLGHADFARRSLDFFVHRYNTNGFLTTGYTTFGTAWHLWTLGEHYQLTRDQDWLRQRAPELARVGHWIVRQTAKTKKLDAQGQPVPESGLMPPGVLADWNAFACYYTMDAYYFAALRELADALGDIGHADAGFFKSQAAELRANTLRAYAWTQARSPALPLRNGTWIPHYPSQVHSPGPLADFFPAEDSGRSWCYDVELGAHQLVPAGILAPDSREAGRMSDHMEDAHFLDEGWYDYPKTMNHRDWFNLGGFSKVQSYYTRNCEIYALRDDVKPFIRSYFNTIAAMLNAEVLTFWECFRNVGGWDKTHETGYFLHQTRTMLVTERGDELWLAPFVTSNWLRPDRRVVVKNAPTQFGAVSYEINSHADQGYLEATINPPTRRVPKSLVLRLRHAEGKPMRAVMINGKAHTDFDPKAETIRISPNGAAPIVVRANY